MSLRKHRLVWRNIIIFTVLHIFALNGLYYMLTGKCKFTTCLWTYICGFLSGQGITSGAHRLWAHRAYKAKLPLRIMLCIFQSLALQNSIYEWVRDHRVHHKYTDTDADPHNASRGFFFSHMGWLLVRKHEDVKIKGKNVDMSDLENDAVVMFQKKYFAYFAPFLSLVLPAFVTWYFTNENFYVSWTISCAFRYVLSLHFTWSVNSVAHIWGNKPYDRNIKPTENMAVSFITYGEGWHNYHHVFPWDYKAAELGNYGLNMSTAFIDLMAKIGWAFDLKTTSTEILDKRKKRTGC